MYHLQITKALHATEKKFNNGRKINVILNKDFENIDLVDEVIHEKFNKHLDDLQVESEDVYYFEEKENGHEVAHYHIRLTHD